MKIIAVLLNPTIDVIYEISDFKVGETFKVEKKRIFPVGKGISFSLAGRKLDKTIKLKVLAFIGRKDVNCYSEFLRSKKINYEFIKIDGETRSNKTINDPINNTTTHIRELGFILNQKKIQKMKFLLKKEIKKGDICLFSGSIPPQTDENIYRELIQLSKEKGAICVLDSSGKALIKGIEAVPHIIKPNLKELLQILESENLQISASKEISYDYRKIVKITKPLLKKGLKIILITLGARGAIMVTSTLIKIGKIEVQNVIDTVGSGDSFLAGFLVKYCKGNSLENCFCFALAAGAANTTKLGPGQFDTSKFYSLLDEVVLFP
ncbi:MAG: putative Tagatose-6-phosphate kinase [Promethearchaeota archaeon]|nr:MAG: putative Tagatose-6-phosphate kinase [Candidatus Lokiarchaeota archaeon]